METGRRAEQAASNARREQKRQERLEEEIREVQESLKELKEMQHAYGDAGTVAFILGIPVKDALRVTGGHDEDAGGSPRAQPGGTS